MPVTGVTSVKVISVPPAGLNLTATFSAVINASFSIKFNNYQNY